VENEFEKDRKLISRWEERRQRATARLAKVTRRCWYYPILGLETELAEYEFGNHLRLQPVVEPPGEVELAAALKDATLFGAIGRYSHGIRYELSVDRDFIGNDDVCRKLAWTLVAAIRVRTLAEVIVPAVADHSWSTIAAITNNTCDARLLEDVPMARSFGTNQPLRLADLQWIDTHFMDIQKLSRIPRFMTAVEALTTHHHHASHRVMSALLWTGIESLFQVNAELRFRLAALIALKLEARGPRCLTLFRRIKALYDVRSKVVHGAEVDDDKLVDHVLEVRKLLSRLVCAFIVDGYMPSPADLDGLIFLAE
jgi:hypothetical protein